ncbi:hypothetical protein T439DRAFT_327962 [Meredithblackwellia eburnea MCA 4105]
MTSSDESVDLLILGAGWTSTFLIPTLKSHHPQIAFAATTRDGRDETIKWAWDQDDQSEEQYLVLPRAKTVLITFPIKGKGGSKTLVEGYHTAKQTNDVRWIQLGSSGIWDGGPTLKSKPPEEKSSFKWTDRHSPFDETNLRAIAEEELLSLCPNTFVLNLSGLWGGTRDPRNWIPRVAPTKEALAGKASIHLIHGLDVARAIIAVHLSPPVYAGEGEKSKSKGERYLLTDLRVYDWWDLILSWGLPPTPSSPLTSDETPLGPHPQWVLQLLQENDVRALPRSPEQLGRALDSRDFWTEFGLSPVRGRVERGRL